MKVVDVDIWHDSGGRIIAIGRMPEHRSHGAPMKRIIPTLTDGQFHLETQVEQDKIAKLHETHRVDVSARALEAIHKTPAS